MKEKKTVSYKSSKTSEPAVLRDAAVAEWGRIVSVRDAKAHLSALLEWVSAGHELTITGMGDYLMKQPIHGGPSAEEVVREDRDGRGW